MKYLVAILAFGAWSVAHADEGSAYYGLALGTFDYSEQSIDGDFPDDSARGYHLLINYQFLEHLAVEGGYGKSGSLRDSATFLPGPVDVTIRTDFKMLTVRLLGVLPFDNGITLLGGLGYADIDQDLDVTINGQPASGSNSGSEPAYYLGVQYEWDRFAIRLGYEKYDLSGDVDLKEKSIVFFYKI